MGAAPEPRAAGDGGGRRPCALDRGAGDGLCHSRRFPGPRCLMFPLLAVTIALPSDEKAGAAMEEPRKVPTLYEWIGGMPAISKLLETFYARVPSDPILAPVFAEMSPEHSAHVAAFVAEVLGGPKAYSGEHGGHPHMIERHLGRALTQTQRNRWLSVLLECADGIGGPADPEFRSPFVADLECGTRLAGLNSQPGATVTADSPMTAWGSGVVKGPYMP